MSASRLMSASRIAWPTLQAANVSQDIQHQQEETAQRTLRQSYLGLSDGAQRPPLPSCSACMRRVRAAVEHARRVAGLGWCSAEPEQHGEVLEGSQDLCAGVAQRHLVAVGCVPED